MYSQEIIDPHHHLWDLEKLKYDWLSQTGEPVAPIAGSIKPIMTSYLLDDYRRDTRNWNIVGDVHLEALPNDGVAEVKWLNEIREQSGWPKCVIAHANLEDPNVNVLLEHYAANGVRGVRQVLNWHEDSRYAFVTRNDLMSDPQWQIGYSLLKKLDLSFDLQIYPGQMREAAKLVEKNAATQVILNHTGMPLERDDRGLNLWRDGMRALASATNVAVKISGLGMVYPDWTAAGIRPLVLETLQIFGVDRCMFASNFPVDRIYSTFDRIYEAFDEIASDLSLTDQRKLFYENAKRIYRL